MLLCRPVVKTLHRLNPVKPARGMSAGLARSRLMHVLRSSTSLLNGPKSSAPVKAWKLSPEGIERIKTTIKKFRHEQADLDSNMKDKMDLSNHNKPFSAYYKPNLEISTKQVGLMSSKGNSLNLSKSSKPQEGNSKSQGEALLSVDLNSLLSVDLKLEPLKNFAVNGQHFPKVINPRFFSVEATMLKKTSKKEMKVFPRISTRNAGQLLHENEHISTTWETDPGLHSLFVKKSSA